LLALLGLLAACSSGGGSASPAEGATPSVHTYVALGDSYTAAPYVPVTDLADGCFRSDANYPHLVAERLHARLTDVSCSGADTGSVIHPQSVAQGRGTVPPQIKAVGPGDDLVTVGIGGNDNGLFASLVYGCTAVADQHGRPCVHQLRKRYGDPARVIAQTGRHVATVLRLVHHEAPHAVVVLVGYPRIVAADRGCTGIRLAPGDRAVVAHLELLLEQAMQRAAKSTGSRFADLRSVSRGHEICSRDPWINGSVTDSQRALAYHPFAVEQQAAASAVLGAIRGSGRG
jgi:lysophospholipase L1-like esterase